MIDETGQGPAAGTESPRVGFCQDCGRPLTAETVRQVGTGVFCEPCLQTRVGFGSVPGYGAPIPPGQGRPSPVLALFLGFIPGVGAMYNGQYAKGLAHFVIFAILSSLADGHGLFGLLCFGWFCYQIFDAYHTAKARRDGLPLPNPFGLNDIGERMGFGKNWPGSSTRPVTPPAPAAAAPPPPPPPPAAPYAPVPPPPATSDWVGYVPPTQFAQSPQVAPQPYPPAYVPPPTPEAMAESIRAQAMRDAGYASVPYTAVPYSSPATSVVPPPPVPAKRFPVGAIWLIGLGLIFLLVNLDSSLHISWQWVVPVILIAVAAMSVTRRMSYLSTERSVGSMLSCLRWPAMLVILAVLFALQAAHWFTLGQTWPVLVIALGALTLIERSTSYVSTPPFVAPPVAEPLAPTPRADWTSSDNTPKDGQA